MKCNKKDLFFTYILGIVMLILFWSLMVIPQIDTLLLPLILFLIPGGFYFYRNICDFKNAIIISIIYGFTFYPIFILVFGLPLFALNSIFMGYFPDFEIVDYFINPIEIFITVLFDLGLKISIPTFISYLLLKYLIGKPN